MSSSGWELLSAQLSPVPAFRIRRTPPHESNGGHEYRFSACDTFTAGPNSRIAAPAIVAFEAGDRVILANGYSVDAGAAFVANINRALAL